MSAHFSSAERESLAGAFEVALAKLEQSTPSRDSANIETNNHFDAAFHQRLLNGEHLKKNAS